MTGFWNSKTVRVLSVVLVAQAGVFYGFSRQEAVLPHKQLADFQFAGTPWVSVQDQQLDQETLDVLKADDILARVYRNVDTGSVATMFVAFFKTQRTGKTPHSPKNCLPGSGWVSLESGYLTIPIQGAPPIQVNRYIVAHGENQSVVLYWYQSHNRVVASEYTAKIFTVADSIRYNRSDTALVRVVTDARGGDTAQATAQAVSLVEAFFTPLKQFLGE
ncbi:MAG TPA: EpsI family protein [Bryobacteraceae bacterium]|jgi:EpsI family protein|nr:EpsI family protein [Bryobacteraceae bacterium]